MCVISLLLLWLRAVTITILKVNSPAYKMEEMDKESVPTAGSRVFSSAEMRKHTHTHTHKHMNACDS